ncbi:transcriptional coactivator p15/PC4 family protein [Bradyrhizobium erythrophlei]|uniref:Transcriptional Coactivator p15 (PC4) n=1 Tax=Bradyrhizobium erythrophlei TaxID=1437360 RepID=A0A1M5QS28_9BRAD|nr:transcriptional coactivator p15/PC4 family protein [Bradyrhizobium erythrophlei]SHH16758.1 Transcriptional Coactivator p15 (PC4) [Bradyrhizobium erythrophlei]
MSSYRKTDRQMPVRQCPIAENEPIEIAKFWKSRNHAEYVRVELSEYKGHQLINVRIWQTGTDGIDRPSTRGIAMSVRKLPELASALAKAETMAIELGLISDGAAGSDQGGSE